MIKVHVGITEDSIDSHFRGNDRDVRMTPVKQGFTGQAEDGGRGWVFGKIRELLLLEEQGF